MAALGLAYVGLGRADDALRHASRAVELLPRERDAAEAPLYLYLLAACTRGSANSRRRWPSRRHVRGARVLQ